MKLNTLLILAIFLVPLALYSFLGSESNIFTSNISVAQGNKPKMVMITSPMCGECVKMKKIIHQVQPSYQNDVIFERFEADSSSAQPYIKKYNITVVPTMIFFKKNGQLYTKIEGSIPQSQLENYLKELKNG
ncbi:MAG: thioredoxin family protein [Candidatus Gastranaerophilales bacterium]|nr:thioredoxin family protein [Candidatus Gastranaerophilales bacterium]